MSELLQGNMLRVLQRSPFDDAPSGAACDSHPLAVSPNAHAWKPSRFNARTISDDGGMVLWNTLSGTINYFDHAQVEEVTEILRSRKWTGDLSPLGTYLQRRGYIVRDDVDEYKMMQLAFGEQQYRSDILELILLASEDCNFRCTYCYETFSRGTMQASVRTGIKKLVDGRAPALRHLSIGWFGGEPLYGFEAIEDLAPHFLKVAHANGVSLSGHITTNGYLLDEDKFVKLVSWKVTQFQITLDGTPEQHNARRPARDGSGTYDTIMENLRHIGRRQESFKVSVRVNYDRDSIDGMEDLVRELAAHFGRDRRFRVDFHPISPLGGPNDADLPLCGTTDAKHASREFRQLTRAHGLETSTLRGNSGLGSQVCYAARPYNLVIGATGTLMKCTVTLDHQPENIVGRIDESGTLTLDRQNLALWVEPAFASDSSCQRCYLLPSCQGMHCPLVRIRDGQTPCPPVKADLHGELEAAIK